MSFSIVAKEKLRNRIELHFYEDLASSEYKVETIDATQLLTWNRFDLSFKLMFLKMISHDVKFAQKAYEEHIGAFSLGKFKEPGDSQKDNITNYIKVFHDIFNDIKNYGFDDNKSIIPISKNGSIANGSHRVASAIILGREIDCVYIGADYHIYNYNFFYKRNVPIDIMDAAANAFVKYATNVFIAIIWPAAVGKNQEIDEILKNIVYKKEVKLNANGAHNLISQIYYGEEWIGSVEDSFKGSQGKLVECFKSFEPVRFVVFQSDFFDEVTQMKEKIRNIFNIGKHSIHITDTSQETLRVARMAFNDNSIHFLNHAKPNKYISTSQKVGKFKEFLNKNKLNSSDVLLDSSITLSAYGLREARDTDFLCANNEKIKYKFESINTHDEELDHYEEGKLEMIYNQNLHFYFNDIKFISLAKLYKMKINRNEEKDANDCKLIESLIEDNLFKEYSGKFIQNIYYGKIKFRHGFMSFLRMIGLYSILKRIYKSFGLLKK